ncbi:hypothetical protein PV08_01474 [Exophiala spinifera]|uniref:Uncharacterized protein n=1 Tax=Exophiala spinifera TaxID=91928 RepID=A0A0D2BR17_9EURO|nr:uncharacterized protein PV08_01474 [Exophiala spinifera]KIW20895.1 hypothetical protein PV08_01474 [Exophiala spinifera]
MLLQDPRLPELFERYPLLRQKLKSIFETTAEENSEISSNARHHGQPKAAKPPAQRIVRSLQNLEKELSSDNAERIGLKAFADLVVAVNSNQARKT